MQISRAHIVSSSSSSSLTVFCPGVVVTPARNGVGRCSGDGFDFFFTDAAFLHITPFFVNPRLFFFFYLFICGRAARVQLPSPGPFGPSSH